MNTQDIPRTPEKLSNAVKIPNAPKKPSKAETCRGCEEEQPNQLAHIGPGGCLEEAFNAVYELK